jgi:hypothetical protein
MHGRYEVFERHYRLSRCIWIWACVMGGRRLFVYTAILVKRERERKIVIGVVFTFGKMALAV